MTDENSFYTWQGYEGYYYEPTNMLRRFSFKGDLMFESKLPFGTGKLKEADFASFVHFNNRLYVIYSIPERKKKKCDIRLQEINKITGNFIGNYTKLHTTYYATLKKTGFLPNDVAYRVSPDGQTLLIVIRDKESSGKSNFSNKATLLVFNNRMEMRWHEPKRRVFRGKDFFITDFLVDDEGVAYMAGQVFEERDRLTGGHYFQIIAIPDSAAKVRPLDVGFVDMTITDLDLAFGKKDQILATGLFNESTHLTKVKGVVMVSYNTYHQEIESLLAANLSDRLIASMMDKKKAQKNREIDQLYLESALDDEGTITLIAQRGSRKPLDGRYAIPRLPGFDDSSPEGRTYGNLLVVRLAKSGELLWSHIVPKNLNVSFSQYRAGSYSAFLMNGRTRIFYFKGNLPGKNKPIIMTTIEEDGKMTHEKALRTRGQGYLLSPRLFGIADAQTLILYGQLATKFRYGRLNLP